MSLLPNPNTTHPVPGFPVTYVKPTITRPNIIVGDFTYYSGEDFESRVTHHYAGRYDKIILGTGDVPGCAVLLREMRI